MNTITKKWVNYSIRDGIIFGVYENNLKVDLDDAKHILAQRLSFQKDKDYPFVFHTNGIDMSKEARLFMGKEGVEGISAGAFIVKNYLEKIMFDFFLVVEKPKVPTKGFTNENAAIKWIKKLNNK